MRLLFPTLLFVLVFTTAHSQIDFSVFDRPFVASDAQKEALKSALGAMPKNVPLELDTLEIQEVKGGTRLLISFLAEPYDSIFNTAEDRIQAYLFIPDTKAEKLPAIVAIHQDGPNSHIGKKEAAGIAGDSTLFYGKELFDRGYVVICPDRWGHAMRRRIPNPELEQENEKQEERAYSHWLGQLIMNGRTDTGKEVYDLTRSVDVLYQYSVVDTNRIGAIGHSGGGYNLVPFVFYDERVDLAVSSCGFFETTYWFHENAAKKRSSSLALPGLLQVGIASDFVAYIAPRPLLLTRGLYEWGKSGKWGGFSKLDVDEYQHMERYVQPEYDRLGASKNFQVIYFDEEDGQHAMPPKLKNRVYDWIDAHLKK
ncbi:MAG: acetylxylan esterase [Bacteroidota bacterium]